MIFFFLYFYFIILCILIQQFDLEKSQRPKQLQAGGSDEDPGVAGPCSMVSSSLDDTSVCLPAW